jgi:hypothetical protein
MVRHGGHPARDRVKPESVGQACVWWDYGVVPAMHGSGEASVTAGKL